MTYLCLADGSVFAGESIGAEGHAVGEVVFNTSMTGYQEILTDASYAGQIITFTYPHIGNVGVNSEDFESKKIWASGLVIRDLSPIVSNWRAKQSLSEFLKAQNIVGIAGVDTRRLTRLLREKGAQNGCIIVGENKMLAEKSLKQFSGLNGLDLAKEVTTEKSYEWKENIWQDPTSAPAATPPKKYHVVVYDYGTKLQILRLLVNRSCRVTVVPAKTSANAVFSMNPDGIVLSNGPGDPAACDYAIENTKVFLAKKIPLFGVCLGCQILALASDGETEKMKLGHHGANHPVKDLRTNRVLITSQNHGFSVKEKTLPKSLKITHKSLFDGTIQGIAHENKMAFGFQGHPEASPGPQDIEYLFDEFMGLVAK